MGCVLLRQARRDKSIKTAEGGAQRAQVALGAAVDDEAEVAIEELALVLAELDLARDGPDPFVEGAGPDVEGAVAAGGEDVEGG